MTKSHKKHNKIKSYKVVNDGAKTERPKFPQQINEITDTQNDNEDEKTHINDSKEVVHYE